MGQPSLVWRWRGVKRTQRASLPVTGVVVDLIHGPGAERHFARLVQVLVHEPIAHRPSGRQREIDLPVAGTSTVAIKARRILARHTSMAAVKWRRILAQIRIC